MGGGASKPPGPSAESRLHTCLFEVFALLGAATQPTTKDISRVVSECAQAIALAEHGMLFFKDEVKMQLLYMPPGEKEFASVELGLMGGPGVVGQVAQNGSVFNSAAGSLLWDAVAGAEPSFKHCTDVRSCVAVPVKTVDGMVIGVVVALNRRGRDAGFTPEDEQNLVQLCERISPIINRSAPEVSFAALDAAKGPEDEGLKQMLSNFGRGDKRDVRQVMKKRVRQLINVQRLVRPRAGPRCEPSAVAFLRCSPAS